MRSFVPSLALLVLAATSGCSEYRYMRREQEPRWAPSIICTPPIQAALGYVPGHQDYIKDEEVTVYGYEDNVKLHFSLREASLSQLLVACGGLPKFGGSGREHLGVVRAACDFPGGEGYAFSFVNWRRRDALALLADVTGRAIIVGPDVNDTIDVEVSGAPPIAILRLLANEGGVIILEDDEAY
jgi:hypothetical protein